MNRLFMVQRLHLCICRGNVFKPTYIQKLFLHLNALNDSDKYLYNMLLTVKIVLETLNKIFIFIKHVKKIFFKFTNEVSLQILVLHLIISTFYLHNYFNCERAEKYFYKEKQSTYHF